MLPLHIIPAIKLWSCAMHCCAHLCRALEPRGCTRFKIHVSCKCLGCYCGTVEVGSPFILAVLLHHWVISVRHFKTLWWLSCQASLCPADPWRRNHCNVYKCWAQVTHWCTATSITCLAILNDVSHIFTDSVLLCFYSLMYQRIIKSTWLYLL